MMVNCYAYGHDFGNSETCGVVMYEDRTIRSITLPSESSVDELRRLRSLDIRMKSSYYVFRNDSIEKYIGLLAVEQGSSPFAARGDVSRYYSDFSLHHLLTASAILIPDVEYTINVFTGIPVQVYIDNSEIRRLIRRALEGTYTFSINEVQRTAHVNIRGIAMEGAGAMVQYGLPGRVRQGVIDIGGETTDLYASIGQEPLQNLCKSIDLGVENAYDQLERQLSAIYQRTLDRQEAREIMHAYINGKRLPAIHNDGLEIVGIADQVRNAIDTIGKEVVSHVSATWKDNYAGKVGSRFARVILIGGGAYYYHTQLERYINNLIVPQQPEIANAVGYAAMAFSDMERRTHASR